MPPLSAGRNLRSRSVPVIALAIGLWLGAGEVQPALATASPAQPSAVSATTLAAWDGDIDLYRKGVFTTQKSWLWCTAAGVQIVRNIVERAEDHTTRSQRTYFDWMRRHNKYTLPESAGVDPAGWTAGLRHFVDDRYRLVASKSFDTALRSAAKALRLTGLPVALTVANGGHGWIMTGFSATDDPATTGEFKVTSVRVVGPLFGRQSKNGYDMKPGTSLTAKELRRFLTPWRYEPKAMIWDGKYVTIQPVPPKATPTAAAPTIAPAASRTPEPTVPSPSSVAPASPSPVEVPDATPGPVAAGAAEGPPVPSRSPVGSATARVELVGERLRPVLLVAGVALACLLTAAVAWRRALRRGRRRERS